MDLLEQSRVVSLMNGRRSYTEADGRAINCQYCDNGDTRLLGTTRLDTITCTGSFF